MSLGIDLDNIRTGDERKRRTDQQLKRMVFPGEAPGADEVRTPEEIPTQEEVPRTTDTQPAAQSTDAPAERPRRGRPPGSKTQRERAPRPPRKANAGEQNPQVRIRLSVETQATIDKLVRIRRNARNDLAPMSRGELVDAIFQAIEEKLDQRDLACADDISGYLSEHLS